MTRNGILAGGNFIVDHVKIVDHYPREEMLATILSRTSSNGGGPYNLLKDLANLQAPFPLAAVGLLGADAAGDGIIADCRRAGIDVDQLQRTEDKPTSFTDAMTVAGTGQRTFFHHRGANALLDIAHFDFSKTQARIFYLGYLLLLDQLDRVEGDRSRASLVLESAKYHGLETCVDMVSVDDDRFQIVAQAALPWTDHLVINETEAGKVIGKELGASDPEAMLQAARQLLTMGVRKTATIHSRFGAVCCEASGQDCVRAALELQPDFPVRGSNGAGDAFAAGYLLGLHEAAAIDQRLTLAVCAAAMSLTDPSPSDGLRPHPECLALTNAHPSGSFGG